VSVELFLCSETQAKIIGRHRLAGKIFVIDVIRNHPSFDAQGISTSKSRFI